MSMEVGLPAETQTQTLEYRDTANDLMSRYRWTICALLFFATTINYIDRQVLGILAPTLQHDIGWSETQYGAIVSWFTLAYALGYLGSGRLMDRKIGRAHV